MNGKNTEQIQENKMGVMPVNKLVWNMSFPMMVSMLVQALYNIVDSIFVSRINEYALRAVSLAFPIQSLMIAVLVPRLFQFLIIKLLMFAVCKNHVCVVGALRPCS